MAVNPSSETLFKYPGAISKIGSPRNPGKQLKAQIKALQSLYRYVRECIPHNGQSTLDLLLNTFNKYHTHLKYVDYIENTIVHLPHDHYSRWVELPLQPLLAGIEDIISNHTNLNTLYTFISALIWKSFTDSNIIPSTLVRNSAKLNMSYRTWEKHAGLLNLNYRYGSTKFAKRFVKHLNIPPQSILKLNNRSRPSVVPVTGKSGNIQLNPQLEDQFIYHKTYYPKSSFILYDSLFPMIYFSNDEQFVSVPLVEGISPIIILTVAGYDAIYHWFQSVGKKDTYKIIHSLEHEVNKSIQHYLNKANYIHPRKAFLQMGFPRLVMDYSIDNVLIMDTGIPINIPSFKAKTISINNNAKDPKKDQQERSDERDTIINNANKNGGFCKGYTTLKSASGRTYYRHFNITGFRSEFKDIVEIPGRKLWYFDVVANDLSILFNISGDQNGLDCLEAQECPYELIVQKAKSNNINVSRDAVKKFINPYLYGAVLSTIVSNSNGALDLKKSNQIKQLVQNTFPQAIKWRKDIIKSVSTKELIPNRLNPFKDGVIPMPKKLARRTACSIIIQRMGAEFMRVVIQYIMNYSSPKFDVSAYVHDSLLLIPIVDMEDAFLDSHIAEALRYSRSRTTGLKSINVRIGHGNTWRDAEAHSKTESIFTVKR